MSESESAPTLVERWFENLRGIYECRPEAYTSKILLLPKLEVRAEPFVVLVRPTRHHCRDNPICPSHIVAIPKGSPLAVCIPYINFVQGSVIHPVRHIGWRWIRDGCNPGVVIDFHPSRVGGVEFLICLVGSRRPYFLLDFLRERVSYCDFFSEKRLSTLKDSTLLFGQV